MRSRIVWIQIIARSTILVLLSTSPTARNYSVCLHSKGQPVLVSVRISTSISPTKGISFTHLQVFRIMAFSTTKSLYKTRVMSSTESAIITATAGTGTFTRVRDTTGVFLIRSQTKSVKLDIDSKSTLSAKYTRSVYHKSVVL